MKTPTNLGGNLLQFSEQFDNAVWAKASTGATAAPTVTANAVIDPNGNLTADKIVFSSSDGSSNLTAAQTVNIPAPNGVTNYCFSLWLRADAPVSNLIITLRKGGVFGTL